MLGDSAKKSFHWSLLIQLSNQIFGFITTLVLARLLSPADFGVLGIMTIFINLAKKITDGGFAASLIRTKDIDEMDFAVVFYFNLGCSLFLYAVLFFTSPFIAHFFEVPLVEQLLKVYGLSIVISAFTITQSVRLNRALDFKTQFKILLPSLLISGLIGVVAALQGYGVWSLVIKELAFALFASLQLWYYSKWKPLFSFDRIIFKRHFNFGYKLVLTDLTSQLFKDSYHAIISKSFSLAQLGYFTRAKSMEELPNSIVFNTINRVLFPMLSEEQDNHIRLKEVYSQIIKVVTFIVTPFLMLLYLVAEPLFIFLLTDKWLSAVTYFKILIINGMISPLQPYLLNICKVKGRSDLVLKLSVVEYFFTVLSMLAIIPYGIEGLLWGLVFATSAKSIVAMIFAGRLIEYSLKEQFLDLKEGFLISGILFVLVQIINKFLPFEDYSSIYHLIAITILFYSMMLIVTYILRFESIALIKKLILNK
jgi:teichuronic acid exporter